MRATLPAFVSLLTLAVACAGCGDAPGGASRNPFASFASRCDALQASPAQIRVMPLAVAENVQRPRAELTRDNQHADPRRQTLGLTEATIGFATSVETEGLVDRNGITCARARIRVDVSLAPVTVFVARELAGDACRYAAVRAHEQKHVEAGRSLLAGIPARLAARLDAAGMGRLYYAASSAALEQAVNADVDRVVAALLAETKAELATRQAAIDTPEEYAAVSAACGGFPADGPPRPPDRR